MSRIPPLWCEARCGGTINSVADIDMPCRQTASGGWSEKEGREVAREEGWITRYGEWWCPACQKAGRVKENQP